MVRPILACENPYKCAKEFIKAGWTVDFSQPPESGDPLVGISLFDNSFLLGYSTLLFPKLYLIKYMSNIRNIAQGFYDTYMSRKPYFCTKYDLNMPIFYPFFVKDTL